MNTRLSLVRGGGRNSSVSVSDDQGRDDNSLRSPFIERVTDKIRALATVKPALVRLLEWQIDAALDRSETERNGRG